MLFRSAITSIASSYTNTNSYEQNTPCGCATMHTPQHQPTPSLLQAHTMQERRKLKAKEGEKKYHMQIGKFSYHLARKGKRLTRKTMFREKGGGDGVEPQTCWSASRNPTTLLGSRYSTKRDPNRGTTSCSALLIKQGKESKKKGDDSTGIRTLHLLAT